MFTLIRGKWRSLIEGIRNVLYWLPVIYHDRNYDEGYLYKMLHHKLTDMERFFTSEDAYTAEASNTADQIAEAKDIVGRLLDNTYFLDKVEHIDTDEFMSIDDGIFNVNTEHPNYEVWCKASEDGDREREEDKQKLFKLMSENIDGWWD